MFLLCHDDHVISDLDWWRYVQVYPEGNQSNNNQFLAAATGTISAIDGLKVARIFRSQHRMFLEHHHDYCTRP